MLRTSHSSVSTAAPSLLARSCSKIVNCCIIFYWRPLSLLSLLRTLSLLVFSLSPSLSLAVTVTSLAHMLSQLVNCCIASLTATYLSLSPLSLSLSPSPLISLSLFSLLLRWRYYKLALSFSLSLLSWLLSRQRHQLPSLSLATYLSHARTMNERQRLHRRCSHRVG